MQDKNKIFNFANFLTFLRILLVPFFVVAFFCLDGESYTTALVIFLIASFTDLLDGIVARLKNQSTRLGAVLDPLADKLLQASSLVSFTLVGVIPLWFTITLVSIYVVMVIVGCVLFKLKNEIQSNFVGKIGAFLMSIGIFLCFFSQSVNPWHLSVLYAGLVVVIASVFVYFFTNKEKFIKPKTNNQKAAIDN